jgi:hypothetical protein
LKLNKNLIAGMSMSAKNGRQEKDQDKDYSRKKCVNIYDEEKRNFLVV